MKIVLLTSLLTACNTGGFKPSSKQKNRSQTVNAISPGVDGVGSDTQNKPQSKTDEAIDAFVDNSIDRKKTLEQSDEEIFQQFKNFVNKRYPTDEVLEEGESITNSNDVATDFVDIRNENKDYIVDEIRRRLSNSGPGVNDGGSTNYFSDPGKQPGYDGGSYTGQPTLSQQEAIEAINFCQSKALKEKIVTLNFPATQGRVQCAFGANGNLGKRDGFMQAFHMQQKLHQIDSNEVMCGLDIRTENAKFRFDDHVFLNLNGIGLISNVDINKYLTTEKAGLKVLTWNNLRGLEHDKFSKKTTCIDGATRCQLPPTQVRGNLELSLDPRTNEKLAQIVAQDGSKLVFDLIVTGDNNVEIDCQHDGLSIQIKYKYYER